MWNSYNILTFTILRHFRTVPMGTVRILWFFLVLRNFWVGTVKKPPCTWNITKHKIRVVPHMDQMDRVLPYLAELGAVHQKQGIARWFEIDNTNACMTRHLQRHHLDLLGLAYCSALRGVVQVSFSPTSSAVGLWEFFSECKPLLGH